MATDSTANGDDDSSAQDEAEAARRAEQAAAEAELREIRGDVFTDIDAAFAACDVHDKALGLPNEHATRWTEPLRLIDGWLVQRPDRTGELIDRARAYVEHID